MTNLTDTIAAIATGTNQSGIGIVRVSGDDAVSIVDKHFRPHTEGKEIRNLSPYSATYGYLFDENGEDIDEVIVLFMKGPKSYTCQDVCEIDCHGGFVVMQRILNVLIKEGARLAEPGEFTKRAFLGGRIDLSQAESVMDLISSKSEAASRAALSGLSGKLKNEITDIRKDIIHETAFIESALDDPEHYSLDGYSDELDNKLENIKQRIDKLIDSFDNGKIIKEGINTVIVGKPNAGKSSILNVLIGNERAIVTDIAGTTRDTLEENISISGIPLNIVDTAGIRETGDIIEKIGVDKSINAVENSDLVLYIIDSSTKLSDEDARIADIIKDKKLIVIKNKSDLTAKVDDKDIYDLLKTDDINIIDLSAKKEEGFDKLSSLIEKMFLKGYIKYNDEVMITNVRHKNLLISAAESIKLVRESIENAMPEDFYSIDLMNAYESLGFIIGVEIEDDLVDTIFKDFCMGK